MSRMQLSSSVEHLWLAAMQESDMGEPGPDVEQEKQQQALFEEVSAEGLPRSQSARTLFSSSGNHFAFEELTRRGENGDVTPGTKRISDWRLTSGQFPLEAGQNNNAGAAGSPSLSLAASANAAAVVRSPPPPQAPQHQAQVQVPRNSLVDAVLQEDLGNDVSDEEQARLSREFIDCFRRPDKGLSSAVKQLEEMLKAFPDLMFVERNEASVNGFDLCCIRDTLMQRLKDDARFPTLVFTSFERGLKHAGMYVTQSTHGKVPVKRWGFREVTGKGSSSAKKKASAAKRSRQQNDDDYEAQPGEEGREHHPPRKRAGGSADHTADHEDDDEELDGE